jgi:hypothetical protein
MGKWHGLMKNRENVNMLETLSLENFTEKEFLHQN